MRYLIVLYCIIFMGITSCQTKHKSTQQKISTIKKLDCMMGKWLTNTTVFSVTETWTKANDTTLNGTSIMIISGDTALYDSMTITPGQDEIYLSSKNLLTPTGDTDIFRLKKIAKDKITFVKPNMENLESITYHFLNAETLRIMIVSKGKSVESYNMKKVIKK